MTVLPLEYPTSPYVELRTDRLLTPAERVAITAANSSADPGVSWREALMAYRMFAIRSAKDELLNQSVVNDTVIRRVMDTAWQLFVPMFKKATGPMIAEAYIRAFRGVSEDDVPITLIYQLADEHANRVGKYFNETSTEAMIQGFNTYVNRQVPQRAAVERVIDAYGLTPRQMSGYTSATQLHPTKVESTIPRNLKRKIQQYIGKSLADRLGVFQRQETHNLDQQAQQVAWMWLVEHNKLPSNTRKMWMTAKDEKVCVQCGPMNGKKVKVGEHFELPNGNLLYVPGAHVNCRCQVRLQINPFESVEKFYDPHQPRSKDGRWAAGQSQSRQLGHKLNSMETVGAKYADGVTNRFTRQVGRYVTEPRYVLTPLKERDREMARLARGAMIWSQSGKGVDRVRRMASDDQKYYADKMKIRASDKAIDALIKGVQSAPNNAPVLYRGMSVSIDHLNELAPGSSFELPLSSFSADRPLSESFARKWGPLIARNRAKREGTNASAAVHPVLFVVKEKSQALHISQLVAERNAEWLSQGKYQITDVADDNGLTVVFVEHLTNKVSKADDDWEPEEHPRGAGGRFVRKPQAAQPRPDQPPVAEREAPAPEVEDIVAAAQQARRADLEERLREAERRRAEPISLVGEPEGKPISLTGEPTHLAGPVSLTQPVSLTGKPEELVASKPVSLRTREAFAAFKERMALVPQSVFSAAGRAKAHLDFQRTLERLDEEEIARQEVVQRRTRTRHIYRPTVPFGVPGYTVGHYGLVDTTPNENAPMGMVEISDYNDFYPAAESAIADSALQILDENIVQMVESLMDYGAHVVTRQDPNNPNKDLYYSFSQEELFDILHSTVSSQERDRYIEIEWVDEDDNWAGVTSRMSVQEIAEDHFGISGEEVEPVLFQLSEGYEGDTYHESPTRYGQEYWRAPGVYRIVGEKRDNELLGGIPVRLITLEPIVEEQVIEEVLGDEIEEGEIVEEEGEREWRDQRWFKNPPDLPHDRTD